MFAVLKQANIDLKANEDDAYTFTISIAAGEIAFDEIVDWLKKNTSFAESSL